MRVLFVSNLYPPHHEGGYELRCAHVVRALAEQGFEVRVLASDVQVGHGGDTPADADRHPAVVDRRLTHYRRTAPSGWGHTWSLGRSQIEDVRTFSELLESFRPHVVAWWNMEGLTKALLPLPAAHGIPDVAFVEDSWMLTEYGGAGERDRFRWFDYWEGSWGPRALRPLARLAVAAGARGLPPSARTTRPVPLAPSRVCFVSEFLRYEHLRGGLDLPSTAVIYGGVEVDGFLADRSPEEFRRDPLALLFVGYLSRNRGLHTLIEALGLLGEGPARGVTLSVAYGGPIDETDYTRELDRRVAQLGLGERVRFLKRVPHEAMPALYREHQMLVVPTNRAEGLPLTITEAMASGTPVITTGSGGAIELADRVPVPLFPPDHPVALARLLDRLLGAPEELADLGARGQRLVRREFTFDRMIREIRATFEALAARRPGEKPATAPPAQTAPR